MTQNPKRFQTPVTFGNHGCIPLAIIKSGLTLEQILKDIKRQKEIENKIMHLYNKNRTPGEISRLLKLKLSKVKHIIRFDSLGLTYRKVGKKK
ncbi:hypothetical protein [uncultured Winogradskyella sp.]|uniref:hypothetical protein n=1 Tax=uncultured Winogradskyella sp. TaxID=395353 RepID=UPI0026154AED|nr:hypothetical protein [uncultured Winogradskyella sp.]